MSFRVTIHVPMMQIIRQYPHRTLDYAIHQYLNALEIGAPEGFYIEPLEVAADIATLPILVQFADAVRPLLDSLPAGLVGEIIEIPAFPKGARILLLVSVIPTKRGAAGERDVGMGLAPDERSALYGRWIEDRLPGSIPQRVMLTGYSPTTMTRRDSARDFRTVRYTQVNALVEVVVEDPELWHATLCRGIGRHRSFGQGMIRWV